MLFFGCEYLIRLTKEQIIKINKTIGESGTMVNEGNLDFLIDKLNDAKTIEDYATILLFDGIALHIFLNGNKRTMFYAMADFVELNGKKFKYSERNKESLRALLNNIARDRITRNRVKKAIKRSL
jgi:prophage maintenance system killer protein